MAPSQPRETICSLAPVRIDRTLKAERKDLDVIILVIRIGVGLMMLVHGLPKLEKLLHPGPVEFASIFGMGPGLSLFLAVFAEVGCSILLLVGFATRLAAVPLIITMLVAVFYVHLNDPFARQELGLLYLLFYFLLFATGSGKYSADYLIQRRLVAVSK